LSPSFESTAGSTVTDPSIAIATTIIIATANDVNVASRVKSIPAVEMITVAPEMRTARPEVASAASSEDSSLQPRRRSSRSRFK
jgi:fructose-specific phosphotransferase system component IIB